MTEDIEPKLERLCYSVEELHEATGISEEKIYQHLNSRRLIAHKVDSRTVVLREDALAWLRACPPYEPTTRRRG